MLFREFRSGSTRLGRGIGGVLIPSRTVNGARTKVPSPVLFLGAAVPAAAPAPLQLRARRRPVGGCRTESPSVVARRPHDLVEVADEAGKADRSKAFPSTPMITPTKETR